MKIDVSISLKGIQCNEKPVQLIQWLHQRPFNGGGKSELPSSVVGVIYCQLKLLEPVSIVVLLSGKK